jgi:hypothetical protein
MSDSDIKMPAVVVHATRTYRVVVAPLTWDGTMKGVDGYRVMNRDTGVCEGEGSILSTAKVYADKLQAMLDQYEDGSSTAPLGGDVN